jgi:hypothetical protein
MPASVDGLFLCSWGDIQLFASSIEWDAGNTLVQHDLAIGDDHPIQPRGEHLGKARVQLMFDDFDGATETGTEAYRRFRLSLKERRIFTHPVEGSFFALIGDCTPSMDEHSIMHASCEFVPDAPVVPVAPSGAGTTGAAGELAVAAAADQVAKQLRLAGLGFEPAAIKKFDFALPPNINIAVAFDVNLDVNIAVGFSASASASATLTAEAEATLTASAKAKGEASVLAFSTIYASAFAFAQVTAVAEASGMAGASAFAYAYAAAALDADVRASVAAWTDAEDEDELAIGKVIIDSERLSESIATMIDQGGFTTDVDLYPAYEAAIMLGATVRSSAIAATVETPSMFVMRVRSRTSLLALCAMVYGGGDAQGQARRVASINSIGTPGWLEPGDYYMPTRRGGAAVQVA